MGIKMKGIRCCGDCGYYDWKKHRCPRATDKGDNKSSFYADCPLPDVVVAQQPHLLTLDEIHDSMVVYLEAGTEFLGIVDDDGVVLAIGGSERIGAKCFLTVWDVSTAAMNDEYNVTWRAWSQRPTKEQREREPWDRRTRNDQR